MTDETNNPEDLDEDELDEDEMPTFICTYCDTVLEPIEDPDDLNDWVCPRCKLEF